MRPWLRNSGLSIAGVLVGVLAISPTVLGQNALGYIKTFAKYWQLCLIIALMLTSIVLFVLLIRRNGVSRQNNTHIDERPTVFPSRQARPYKDHLDAALTKAKSIDAIGISNNRLTSDVNVDFYKSLLIERQGKIRLIFLDPTSEAIKERERLEHRQSGSLSGLVQHNIEDIRRFVTHLGLSSAFVAERVSIRTVPFFVGLNVITCDELDAFVHHYGRSTRGFDSPALHVSSRNKDEFEFFKNEFENVWKESTPVKVL